jgi:dTDP-glucose 4,6-dehydratase
MTIMITGGAGFIGSNFVHHMLREHADYDLVVVDKLTYAGNLRNLEAALNNPRFRLVRMDICDPAVSEVVAGCDLVVHMAAESHVDRSIENAGDFVRTNVEGTWRLLDSCRQAKVPRLVHVSTDEVYGSLGPTGKFTETTPLAPNSPYAATKAASDLLVLAYVHTHGFPAIVTRCSNNYGPYQFPEKFIPLMIAQALSRQKLPVYGDGQNVRDWIHVSDHCRALDVIAQRGKEGETYNIGGNAEMKNLEVAKRILRILDRPESLLEFVKDRPGHDRRYALDSSKLERELGWQPLWRFDTGLQETIRWYQENTAWLEETRSGQYRDYFERHYTRREQTFSAGTVS